MFTLRQAIKLRDTIRMLANALDPTIEWESTNKKRISVAVFSQGSQRIHRSNSYYAPVAEDAEGGGCQSPPSAVAPVQKAPSSMTLRELKAAIVAAKLDSIGCIERQDFVQLLAQARAKETGASESMATNSAVTDGATAGRVGASVGAPTNGGAFGDQSKPDSTKDDGIEQRPVYRATARSVASAAASTADPPPSATLRRESSRSAPPRVVQSPRRGAAGAAGGERQSTDASKLQPCVPEPSPDDGVIVHDSIETDDEDDDEEEEGAASDISSHEVDDVSEDDSADGDTVDADRTLERNSYAMFSPSDGSTSTEGQTGLQIRTTSPSCEETFATSSNPIHERADARWMKRQQRRRSTHAGGANAIGAGALRQKITTKGSSGEGHIADAEKPRQASVGGVITDDLNSTGLVNSKHQQVWVDCLEPQRETPKAPTPDADAPGYVLRIELVAIEGIPPSWDGKLRNPFAYFSTGEAKATSSKQLETNEPLWYEYV